MSPKRNLQTLFARARQETSPVSSDDVRSIVENVGSAPLPSTSMPIIITTTVATLAMAAGLTAYILSPEPPQQTQSVLGAVAEPRPTTREIRVIEPAADSPSDDITETSVKREGESTMSIAVLSLESGDLQQLNIDVASLGILRTMVPHADSIAQCMPRPRSANGTICVWKNGERQEVALRNGPGPMPVMFTSADGRGKVVRIEMSRSFDPNELIPVEAPSSDGTMLMWFCPTQDVMQMLPEGVEKQLCKERGTQDLNLDIQVVNDGELAEIHSLNIDSLVRSIPMLDTMNAHSREMLASIKTIVLDGGTDSTQPKSMTWVTQSDTSIGQRKVVQRRIEIKRMGTHITADADILTSLDSTLPSCARMSTKSRVIILRRGGSPKAIIPNVDGSQLQENRVESGALRLENIYPNPTMDGGATVSYELTGDRQISIDLHDLAGNKVATLATGIRKQAGAGQIAFTLDGVMPGMYLVTLTTDKGERAVQRLIVQ